MPEVNFGSLVHDDASRGMRTAFTSSVKVHTIGQNGRGLGSGNVIRFEDKLYIFTAAHVVRDAVFLTVTEKDGRYINVEVLHVDEKLDFAILKVLTDPRSTIAANYKHRSDNLIGKPVVHCGHPSVAMFNVSQGMITGFDGNDYLTDAMALPGSSGGVLFGERGDIIGVVVSIGVVNVLGPPELVEEIVRVAPVDYLYLRGVLGEQGSDN